MRQRLGFVAGALIYVCGFIGYVFTETDISNLVGLTMAGCLLMFVSLLSVYWEMNRHFSHEQACSFSSMLRWFFLLACLISVHALTEIALNWQNPIPNQDPLPKMSFNITRS